MAILWSPEGGDDILTALSYLRERSPAAAERLAASVNETLQRVAELSLEGPERTLTSGAVVRSWPIPPSRVYYQRRGQDLLQRRKPIERR